MENQVQNAGDYDKVMGFLNRFDNDINLAFAGSLKFWENFLNGDVKEEKLRVTHEAFLRISDQMHHRA